jgi:hypothetical protein
MIKRVMSLLFAMMLLLLSSPAAYADVVFGNDFYSRKGGRSMVEGRSTGSRIFIINSPSGYVVPRIEPGAGRGVPTGLGYSKDIHRQLRCGYVG